MLVFWDCPQPVKMDGNGKFIITEKDCEVVIPHTHCFWLCGHKIIGYAGHWVYLIVETGSVPEYKILKDFWFEHMDELNLFVSGLRAIVK